MPLDFWSLLPENIAATLTNVNKSKIRISATAATEASGSARTAKTIMTPLNTKAWRVWFSDGAFRRHLEVAITAHGEGHP